jgi:hypothetical protein
MVADFDTSNLLAMSGRAPLPPFQAESGRMALAAFALAGTFALASAPTQVSSTLRRTAAVSMQPGELVEFKTDECGDLSAVQSSRTILSESSSIGDSDDEDDSTSAWGMSDEDRAVSEQWRVHHPDVAIDTDAVQRSCGSDPLDEHEPGTSGVA